MGVFSMMPGWLIWPVLFCLWPAWSIFLWKFGIKRKSAVALPILVGLAIMWRLFEELFGLILMLVGAARM
jgi:hypothetical protein